MTKAYGQFCPIAKASEIFAARWTRLVLRELMADIHSFNDIHRGVPLIFAQWERLIRKPDRWPHASGKSARLQAILL
jgi:hypothetical protein